jgi:hypothetical protein
MVEMMMSSVVGRREEIDVAEQHGSFSDLV